MNLTPPDGHSWQSLLGLVAAAWPPERWRDLGVVVGCSGGADSVALLTALSQLREAAEDEDIPRGFLVAAHFNHGLRGEESSADEAFVRQLADELGVRFESQSAGHRHRDEASMRAQRLQFLVATACARGARYVALAHSADDNVETVLHHLMRGTGPAGLAGIASHRPLDDDLVLVRPLLGARRDAIRAALTELNRPWREDSSNMNTDYRRNWIRHQLLPLMESQYPSATAAIIRAIDGQQEWRNTIDHQARGWLDQHRRRGVPVTLERDARTDQSIIIAALQALWHDQGWPRGEMDRSHWQRLAATCMGSQQQRYTLPAAIDVSSDGRVVTIRCV